MHHELILAGFGGQGIMFAGQLLTFAGMLEDKHVSWIPSYGPEMRGGTANCSVVVSDNEISSPIVTEPTVLLAFNLPSLDKFESNVLAEGLVVYNSSLIDREPERTDFTALKVPANEIAEKLGSAKVTNMVMLGAMIKKTGIVSIETVFHSLEKVLPDHRHKLIPLNKQALQAGMDHADRA